MTAQRSGSLMGIVLAAGASTRFGTPKALARMGGLTLLERSIEALTGLAQISDVLVVLGAHHAELRPLAQACGASVLHHQAWARGMTASLRLAVAFALAHRAAGVLVSVVDQPSADRLHFAHMIKHFEAGSTMVSSVYDETCGMPVLFAHQHFAEVLNLADHERGKDVVLRHRLGAHSAFEGLVNGGHDIDTIADLSKFEADPVASLAPSRVPNEPWRCL
jgi:molybdenum cofactor cytidylyltransferase